MSLGLSLRLAIIFAGLNLGWEALQLPLYTIWWSEPWPPIIFALLHCTLGDLMIGSVALALALSTVGQGWATDGWARRRVAIVTTILGMAYTVCSEWLNVEIRQSWAYTELMPRIPPLGTGLAPMLQWLLLPGLALSIATKMDQTSPTSRPTKARAPTASSTQHSQ